MRHEFQSSQFMAWSAKYINLQTLTEEDYDAALYEAQILKNLDLVSEAEWIRMVKFANILLLRVQN